MRNPVSESRYKMISKSHRPSQACCHFNTKTIFFRNVKLRNWPKVSKIIFDASARTFCFWRCNFSGFIFTEKNFGQVVLSFLPNHKYVAGKFETLMTDLRRKSAIFNMTLSPTSTNSSNLGSAGNHRIWLIFTKAKTDCMISEWFHIISFLCFCKATWEN